MKRARKGLAYGAALTFAILGFVAALSVTATADNGSPAVGAVGLCHHTGNSQAHEWVYLEPDASGVFAGHANVNHQEFQFGPEDIIPAFQFTDAHGVVHNYPGLNLLTTYDASLEPVVAGPFTGAVILANHCVAPTIPPTTTTTPPSPPSTVTVTTPAPPPVTVTTPAPPPVTITVTTPAPPPPPPVTVTTTTPAAPVATVTVTTPAPPAVTTTVASPPKVINNTKVVTKTKTVVKIKWRVRLKLVHQCVKPAHTP